MTDTEIIPRPDWHQLYVDRCGNMPAGWRWFALSSSPDEVPDGYVKITGCVPSGVYKSGPRKGRPKFDPPHQVLFVRNDDIRDCLSRWEDETGLCRHCGNTGLRTTSVRADGTRTTAPCGRCPCVMGKEPTE